MRSLIICYYVHHFSFHFCFQVFFCDCPIVLPYINHLTIHTPSILNSHNHTHTRTHWTGIAIVFVLLLFGFVLSGCVENSITFFFVFLFHFNSPSLSLPVYISFLSTPSALSHNRNDGNDVMIYIFFLRYVNHTFRFRHRTPFFVNQQKHQ